MRVVFGIAAVVCTVLTVVWIRMSVQMPRVPQFDFDVTGIGWLFMNVGPVFVRVMAFLFGCLAAFCWVRVLLHR